jgi:hypothetical protein
MGSETSKEGAAKTSAAAVRISLQIISQALLTARAFLVCERAGQDRAEALDIRLGVQGPFVFDGAGPVAQLVRAHA